MAQARRGSLAVPVGVATAWVTPRLELGIREWEKLAPVTAATRGAAGSRRTVTVDSPFPQGIGHLDPTLHPVSSEKSRKRLAQPVLPAPYTLERNFEPARDQKNKFRNIFPEMNHANTRLPVSRDWAFTSHLGGLPSPGPAPGACPPWDGVLSCRAAIRTPTEWAARPVCSTAGSRQQSLVASGRCWSGAVTGIATLTGSAGRSKVLGW